MRQRHRAGLYCNINIKTHCQYRKELKVIYLKMMKWSVFVQNCTQTWLTQEMCGNWIFRRNYLISISLNNCTSVIHTITSMLLQSLCKIMLIKQCEWVRHSSMFGLILLKGLNWKICMMLYLNLKVHLTTYFWDAHNKRNSKLLNKKSHSLCHYFIYAP